jgi:hypothetical protein
MTGVDRAVILLGLLLAAFGALLGAVGSPPVAAAFIVLAGVIAVGAGLWLRRGARGAEPRQFHYTGRDGSSLDEFGNDPYETLQLSRDDAARALATGLYARGKAPPMPPDERVRRERIAARQAEAAREAELNAIAEGLRGLKGRQELAATRIPEWRARIEAWIDADLEARAEKGEDLPPQAMEWMRDFGEIPRKDWRRHLLRHLRRLGYRHYQEGEW